MKLVVSFRTGKVYALGPRLVRGRTTTEVINSIKELATKEKARWIALSLT